MRQVFSCAVQVSLVGAMLTLSLLPIPVHADDTQWICEDTLFPVVVEARSAIDSDIIELKIDSGEFRLPPEAKASIRSTQDTDIILGQIVQQVESEAYNRRTSVTSLARKASTLVEAFDYYVTEGACGVDAEDKADALVNSGKLTKRICGELKIQVPKRPAGVISDFYSNVAGEWTPIATFTVTVEEIAGRWKQTEKRSPDGLCE